VTCSTSKAKSWRSCRRALDQTGGRSRCGAKPATSAARSLRIELGHFGVHVIVVEPGRIGTGALAASRTSVDANDPYLPLAGSKRPLPSELTPPLEIARTIADAIEAPERQFRWPAGTDAEKLLAARATLDDVAFDACCGRRCASSGRSVGSYPYESSNHRAADTSVPGL
jgi:hypothetical protein